MGTGGVGGGMERQGSAHSARAGRGSPPRARLGTARGKRPGRLRRASQGGAQVILGIGVGARKAGAGDGWSKRRAGGGNGRGRWRRARVGEASRWEARLDGLEQRGGVGGQLRL